MAIEPTHVVKRLFSQDCTTSAALRPSSHGYKDDETDIDFFESETLSSEREAEESDEKWSKCKKNPGHVNFIKTQDFSLDDLPKNERQSYRLDYIRKVSALTVRLRVSRTSICRPRQRVRRSKCRASGNTRIGTGFITGIRLNTSPCVCRHCRSFADQPFPKCWLVDVMTACHVVFDTDEAEFTKVDLPKNGEVYDTLYGWQVVETEVLGDWCRFLCVTHEEDVARKIEQRLGQMEMACQQYSACDDCRISDTVVIVSFPHGQPQKITVGKLKTTRFLSYPEFHNQFGDRDIATDRLHLIDGAWWRTCMEHTQVGYDVSTCPGCSGGPVILLSSSPVSTIKTDARFLPFHVRAEGPHGWNSGFAPIQSMYQIWHKFVSPKRKTRQRLSSSFE